MARDMGSVRAALTEELHATLQAQCDQLRAQRRINRLENIAVRSVEVTEAWQESGQEFVTVRFLASLLDFTTDESGSRVIEGSRTEPVKFEEYWTFVRAATAPAPKKGWDEKACPSCGAPIDRMGQSAECGYCNAKVSTGDFGWVLTVIAQDESYRG